LKAALHARNRLRPAAGARPPQAALGLNLVLFVNQAGAG
jgi:hypothetical protein